MGKRFLMLPWRNMICDDCKARGFPPEIYLFYSHWWGMEDDHICPSLIGEEMRKILREEMGKIDKGIFEAGLGI